VNGNFGSGDKELGTRKMNKCAKKQCFFYQTSSWSRHQNALGVWFDFLIHCQLISW
jgi:hypothetical protein